MPNGPVSVAVRKKREREGLGRQRDGEEGTQRAAAAAGEGAMPVQVVSSLPFWMKRWWRKRNPVRLRPLSVMPLSMPVLTTSLTPFSSSRSSEAPKQRAWNAFSSSSESAPSLDAQTTKEFR